MKKIIISLFSIIALIALGFALGHWWLPPSNDTSMGVESAEPKILYWVAPMDANYRRDEPGKSPMGMDLVPVYAETDAGDAPGTVSINPSIINKLGVRTAMAKLSPLARQINTVGYVAYDEDSMYQISTRVSGWVEKLAIKANGESVTRGQVLFELYSPELVNAQQEYLSALNSKSNILHKASRSRLSALGVTAGEIKRLDKERTVKQRIRVYAKADGVITHLGIREGAFITPSTQVMSIANLKQVWVLAEVFERQAAWVENGQQAVVELDALPGQTWTGSVDYIYPEMDAKTRTLKVRLRFDNEAEVFRPNMFARVKIIASDSTPVIHVPREALIRGGTLNRVVLALGDGKFRAQEVVPGIEVSDRVEIISGLSAGAHIVTSGQFLIDSESNIESALSRLTVDDDNDSTMTNSLMTDEDMETTK